jgi:hypothetical protein
MIFKTRFSSEASPEFSPGFRMMVRPGGFWVHSWTARHSLKLKAGGKERAQGRPGRASAERASRNTSCKQVDFLYFV